MQHAWEDEKYVQNWSENLKGIDRLEDVGVDGMIILDWILNRLGGCGLDSSGSG
jgi:hypothetical protein